MNDMIQLLSKKEYKKISDKFIEMSNLSFIRDGQDGFSEHTQLHIRHNYSGYRFGSKLFKSPFTDRSLESNPGVYCGHLEHSDIIFCYYTDAWKKSRYMGGGLKVIIPNHDINSIRTSMTNDYGLHIFDCADKFLTGLQEM